MRTLPFSRKLLLPFGALMLLLWACRKEKTTTPYGALRPHLPSTPYDYTSPAFPAHFDGPPLNFFTSINYPVTNEGAQLGRVLFYDKKLSRNNSLSCGSCHQQRYAFSDPNRLSNGVHGQKTDRQSMAIFNTRFSSRFFWDRRAATIENQVLQPIQNPKEMGMDLVTLRQRLASTDYYPALFTAAFGDSEITDERISIALGMFIQSIVSYSTRYDIAEQTGLANYTPLEKDGYTLYHSGVFNCNHCHGTANFFNSQPLHNGLDSVYADEGVGAITGNPADIGKFKVPSLRNIAVTAPYMHDGRFSTLEQVVEHYNSGIRPHPNLDDRLTTNGTTGGPPKRYYMTAYQKKAIVAFLKTLTDEQMIADPKWSDPFAHR